MRQPNGENKHFFPEPGWREWGFDIILLSLEHTTPPGYAPRIPQKYKLYLHIYIIGIIISYQQLMFPSFPYFPVPVYASLLLTRTNPAPRSPTRRRPSSALFHLPFGAPMIPRPGFLPPFHAYFFPFLNPPQHAETPYPGTSASSSSRGHWSAHEPTRPGGMRYASQLCIFVL